jgi:L-rhamnose mutarotase
VEQVGTVWRVRPGHVEEYDRVHAAVWPELEALMREAGAKRFAIYRWGEIVFAHLEVADYASFTARYDAHPVAQRWEAEIAHLLEVPVVDTATGWPERLSQPWSLPPGASE